jgi:hypothetical protein
MTEEDENIFTLLIFEESVRTDEMYKDSCVCKSVFNYIGKICPISQHVILRLLFTTKCVDTGIYKCWISSVPVIGERQQAVSPKTLQLHSIKLMSNLKLIHLVPCPSNKGKNMISINEK